MPKSDIIRHVSIYLEKYYDEFLAAGGIARLKDDYEEMLVNLGRQVYADDGREVKEYTAMGINEQGELVVKDACGNVKNIRAGEVSVRGIYGYV